MLLQDTMTGGLSALLLSGSGQSVTVTGTPTLGGTVGATRKVVGTRDLNGDGKPDILFQDSATGAISYWLLDNGAVTASGIIPTSGDVSNLKVVGQPDLNRDGKADILLQSASAPPRAKNPYGFVGKAGYYSDEESGLQLLGYRYYRTSVTLFSVSRSSQYRFKKRHATY